MQKWNSFGANSASTGGQVEREGREGRPPRLVQYLIFSVHAKNTYFQLYINSHSPIPNIILLYCNII